MKPLTPSEHLADPTLIVLRYGEIFLKGANRPFFERLLLRNVRRALQGIAVSEIDRGQGRLFVRLDSSAELRLAIGRLANVFGLASLSAAYEAAPDIDSIRETALLAARQLLNRQTVTSFKVAARRSDKTFPLTSPQINREVGGAIHQTLGLAVDVHHPQVTLGIEVGQRCTFVWLGEERGAGGLPVGAAGKVLLLLSGGIDSPVAGYLAQKRGCELHALYFHSPPHTSEHARDKVVQLAERLGRQQGTLDLTVLPFTAVQELLRNEAPNELLVVLYRRMMMRLASTLAAQLGCQALITGENLGQVASQTLENLRCIEDAATLPILRPLLTFDKSETVALAQNIGTFETSIQPYADCCSLFVPRHPATKVSAKRARKVEAAIDTAAVLESALAHSETIRLGGALLKRCR